MVRWRSGVAGFFVACAFPLGEPSVPLDGGRLRCPVGVRPCFARPLGLFLLGVPSTPLVGGRFRRPLGWPLGRLACFASIAPLRRRRGVTSLPLRVAVGPVPLLSVAQCVQDMNSVQASVPKAVRQKKKTGRVNPKWRPLRQTV